MSDSSIAPQGPLRRALSSFATYRRLPAIAGGWLLPISLIARLPIAMLPLGSLGLVSAVYDSVGIAGLASGAVAVGSAVGGPIIGQLADRLGQRPVLLVAGPVNAIALTGAILVVNAVAPVPVVIAAFVVAGLTVPQVSPLVRVRWMSLAAGRRADLGAALSYESTVDELTFVLGPAAVGLLAAAGGAIVPLVTTVVLTLVFVVAFALHPTATLRRRTEMVETGRVGATDDEATVSDTSPTARSTRLLVAVAAPTAAMVAMGTFFGSTQAGVTAFARAAQSDGSAGLLYAVMGIGSALTALALVAVPERISLTTRWIVLAAALALTSPLLVLAGSLSALAGALAVVGLAVGPMMVTIYSLGTARAPLGRETITMTLLQSASVIGVALGSAVAGVVADSAGATTAFLVPVGATIAMVVIAAIAAWTGRDGRRWARERSDH